MVQVSALQQSYSCSVKGFFFFSSQLESTCPGLQSSWQINMASELCLVIYIHSLAHGLSLCTCSDPTISNVSMPESLWRHGDSRGGSAGQSLEKKKKKCTPFWFFFFLSSFQLVQKRGGGFRRVGGSGGALPGQPVNQRRWDRFIDRKQHKRPPLW